ncbi:MAG: hypothetical protein JXA33_17895 [Anaerolineae bacterium]|nr:hypothetical protein [Anaerolineae bacterium]
MTTTERNQQLRIVSEILLQHLPVMLDKDQVLTHDLLAVAGLALQTIYEDVEKSADAWDKRAYHVRADELRREWDWVQAAANYAIGLAIRSAPVTQAALAKLLRLIRPELECPSRRQIQDPVRFQGAARALSLKQAGRRPVLRR